jgi:hypothetical protein
MNEYLSVGSKERVAELQLNEGVAAGCGGQESILPGQETINILLPIPPIDQSPFQTTR